MASSMKSAVCKPIVGNPFSFALFIHSLIHAEATAFHHPFLVKHTYQFRLINIIN